MKNKEVTQNTSPNPSETAINGYTLAAAELLDPKTVEEIKTMWAHALAEGQMKKHQSQEVLERLMESGYRWKECLKTLGSAGILQG